jgi:hypothetical protein
MLFAVIIAFKRSFLLKKIFYIQLHSHALLRPPLSILLASHLNLLFHKIQRSRWLAAVWQLTKGSSFTRVSLFRCIVSTATMADTDAAMNGGQQEM